MVDLFEPPRATDALSASVEPALDAHGYAVLPALFDADRCRRLIAMYDQSHHFRSRIVMARHGFGRGEYQYFAYPLPARLAALRAAWYARLAPLANRWHRQLGLATCFPATHEQFLARCHAAGQDRPTPLLLRYGAGDFNCLHQDLYGDHVFPIQMAVLLSQPGEDFRGGEFVVTQADQGSQRAEVVALERGDAVLFAVNCRPVPGKYRSRQARMRHGVSEVLAGHRHTLGVILHDAR